MTTHDRELVITRTFDVPRTQVYDAWTDRDHILAWWGPRGFTTLACDLEPRAGGTWRVRSRSPEGREYVSRGVFREVVAPERLAFTHAWDDEHGRPGHEELVTVTFAEREGTTEMLFRQGPFESVTTRDGHAEGWSSAFDMLAEAFEQAEIRRLVDGWRRALHAKDVNAAIRHLAPDVLSYDLAPPLLHRGVDVYRKNLEDWFRTFTGPVEYDVRDLCVDSRGDVAFSTSLAHIGGARTDGTQTDVWVRATLVYRKIGGRWLVAHEHLSVPFHMDGSFKAAVDLRP